MAKSDSTTTTAASPNHDSRSDEWTAARATIERFDGYLDSLRKYGFGLVTSLLAVTGYLSSSPSTKLPDTTKLVVSVAILALVVALAFLDGQYRSLQRGATIRARILERSLNLDLSSAISHYVQIHRFGWTYMVVYGVVATSTFVVAFGVLWGDLQAVLLLFAAYIAAIYLIGILGGDQLRGTVDWSVNAKVVNLGDPVRITFTNLRYRQGGDWMYAGCEIRGRSSPGYRYPLSGRPEFRRTKPWLMSQADWVWATNDGTVNEGLYAIIGCWHLVDDNGKSVIEQEPHLRDERTTAKKPNGKPTKPSWHPRWGPSGTAADQEEADYVTFAKQQAYDLPLDSTKIDSDNWPSWALIIQVVKRPSSSVDATHGTPPHGPGGGVTSVHRSLAEETA